MDALSQVLEKMPNNAANYLTWFCEALRLYSAYCQKAREIGENPMNRQAFVKAVLTEVPGSEFIELHGVKQFTNLRLKS